MYKKNKFTLAFEDIVDGTFGTHLWFHLSWMDIKQRYRRSTLGPFWITISMGVMLGAMGPVYAKLFNQPVGSYFQHLAISFIIWSLVSGQINESCSAFISAEGLIKQVKLPFTLHLNRMLSRNIISFAHNIIIMIMVLYFFPPKEFLPFLLLPVGVLLVIINLAWIGLFLSIISARFRDIPLTVASIMQLAFFLTPIVWQRNALGDSTIIADANYLYHLVEIIRAPLLGLYPTNLTWIVVSLSALVGWILAFFIFAKLRNRIVYWL
jgi:lipopolysaccharide transport system permease protein